LLAYRENGKTTLLHILANILNGDFERFAFLPFETIEVHLLEVYKNSLEERAKVQEKSLKVINTYLNSVNRF